MSEKFEENLNKPLGEDAEQVVKAALGEDVFVRPEKETRDVFEKPEEEKPPKDYRPYVHKEIDRLGGELALAKRNLREAKNTDEIKYYEKKVKFFGEELEKAKAKRDEIRQREAKSKEPKEPETKQEELPTELDKEREAA